MPLPNFPTAVLQSSLKIAMERPKGVRTDMLNILKDMDAESLELVGTKAVGGSKPSAPESSAAAAVPSIPPLSSAASRMMSNRQLLMSFNIGKLNLDQGAAGAATVEDPAAAYAANQRVSAMTGVMWARLVFSLTAFHAIVLERRKFGALGWNVSYEFSFGDFESSLSMVRNLISLQESGDADIQWEAIRYMVGDISYGGRVTDEHDRVLLKCILKRYLSEENVGHPVASGRRGGVPMPDLDLFKPLVAELEKPLRTRRPLVLSLLEEHTRTLSENDAPEIFGLSRNADIAYRVGESKKLVDTLLIVEPRAFGVEGGGGADRGSGGDDGEKDGASTTDEVVLRMASEVLQRLPAPSLLNLELALKDHPNFRPLPSGHDNSLGTVLEQEVSLFTRLLQTMRLSLENLKKAVKGMVLMSKDLEAMYVSILNNQVPLVWSRVAYPSLRPLGSWVENLQERVTFLSKWITGGEPHTFWISAFFFPQGFLTALLQNHARRNQIAIDRLTFGFRVASTRETGGHAEGTLISGLHLEGAKLHPNTGVLAPCGPGEMVDALPLIRFVPQIEDRADAAGPGPGLNSASSALSVASPDVFKCPLYRTRARAGVAMVAGHSSNYVLDLALPIQEGSDPEVWTLNAVAAICELDD